MRIPTFIVDDEPDIRLLLRVIIDQANDGLAVVCEAANGREALERIDECDPAVVVLDEMMPDLTGTETATMIRARRPGQVMILCSAFIDQAVRDRAHAAGIVDCVPKERVEDLPRHILRAVASP